MTEYVKFDDSFFDLWMKHDLYPRDNKVNVAIVVEVLELSECAVGCEEQVNAFIEPVV